MPIKNLFFLFWSVVILCGCASPGVKTIPTHEATYSIEEVQKIPTATATNPADGFAGEFDVKKAFEGMYAGWTILTTDTGKVYAQQEDRGKGLTRKVYVNLAVPFRQQQEDKYLLVTTYSDSQEIRALHSLGGTVFVRQKGQWILEHTGGLADYPGSATSKLVQIGGEQFGVLVHTQYAGTGRGVERAILKAYTSSGWQKVWEELIGEAEFEKWNYSSKVVFLTTGKGEYFDMQVTTTGTNSSLEHFEETRTYSFNEGIYKLMGTVHHEFP